MWVDVRCTADRLQHSVEVEEWQKKQKWNAFKVDKLDCLYWTAWEKNWNGKEIINHYSVRWGKGPLNVDETVPESSSVSAWILRHFDRNSDLMMFVCKTCFEIQTVKWLILSCCRSYICCVTLLFSSLVTQPNHINPFNSSHYDMINIFCGFHLIVIWTRPQVLLGVILHTSFRMMVCAWLHVSFNATLPVEPPGHSYPFCWIQFYRHQLG